MQSSVKRSEAKKVSYRIIGGYFTFSLSREMYQFFGLLTRKGNECLQRKIIFYEDGRGEGEGITAWWSWLFVSSKTSWVSL